ncbi:SGNH/GDSL hydrolase family protein [Nocardioides sp.]|uniref:SGNH/GDSL hydrolase family protein n=1 Tax=Nocardioides sp. TaxID=35761 RepID=UPI001A23947C|nr:SGNH/GDSL hydrolase family protein [Nocardioides sp.]MBJ7358867.1 SGNH/GDSL hydrolase family protein [Nocardioides sp.]
MSPSHPAVAKRRFTAIAVAAMVAWGLTGAGLLATVPAAQSSDRYAGSALAPAVVVQAVVDTAAGAKAQAKERIRAANTLVVFGDSVTARYNDRAGHPEQGFWSMLAGELGARTEVRAQPGAGFVNPGGVGCTGSTFGGQLARPAVAEAVAGAGAVVIEGGRTDTQTCRQGGGYDLVPDRQVGRAAAAFMAQVRRLRGGDPACTVVVVPWGPAGLVANRDRITGIVRAAAARQGFTFVDTLGLLTEATTIEDGVHPTRSGNEALTRAILDQSALEGCFA